MPRRRRVPPSRTIKACREAHELLALKALDLHARAVALAADRIRALEAERTPPRRW